MSKPSRWHALIPAPICHKIQSTFTLFEEGKSKGLKPRQMTGITLQKALERKLAPKLSQFRAFQGLQVCGLMCIQVHKHSFVYECYVCVIPLPQDSDKEELLDSLLARKVSFDEAEKRSVQMKTLASTKEAIPERDRR